MLTLPIIVKQNSVSASLLIGLFHDTPHWDWYVTGSLGLRGWQASGLPKVTSRASKGTLPLERYAQRATSVSSRLMYRCPCTLPLERYAQRLPERS
ncbi:hypothetical protein Q3G72_002692 [Acer saccharum]|nr:hypothetical protein Q3G72_002692 [Acer saccharum]